MDPDPVAKPTQIKGKSTFSPKNIAFTNINQPKGGVHSFVNKLTRYLPMALLISLVKELHYIRMYGFLELLKMSKYMTNLTI